MITSYSETTELGEVGFLDENDNVIKIKLIFGTELLNDEQDTIQNKVRKLDGDMK